MFKTFGELFRYCTGIIGGTEKRRRGELENVPPRVPAPPAHNNNNANQNGHVAGNPPGQHPQANHPVHLLLHAPAPHAAAPHAAVPHAAAPHAAVPHAAAPHAAVPHAPAANALAPPGIPRAAVLQAPVPNAPPPANRRLIFTKTSVQEVRLQRRLTETEQLLGPIPPRFSKIFSGLNFVIIATPIHNQANVTPFSKAHLVNQITAGNGTVLISDLDDAYWRVLKFMVIAETNVVTQCYVKALAVGKECVSHEWIAKCCRENKLLPHEEYLLPAGKSITKNQLINWHGKTRLFSTWSFAIETQTQNSADHKFWKSILSFVNARFVPLNHLMPLNGVNATLRRGVLMIDKCYPTETVRQLRQLKIPLYTPDFLIESLICGEIIDYKKNSKLMFGSRRWQK